MSDVTQLFGVMDGSVQLGPVSSKSGFRLLHHEDLNLIVRTETKRTRPQDRRSAARAMLSHQRVLEVLLAEHSFLPAELDLTFESDSSLLESVSGQNSLILRELQEFGHLHQYQLIVSWRPEAALKELSRTEYGEPLRTALSEGLGKIACGEAIQQGMEAWRGHLGRELSDLIQPTINYYTDLPLRDENHLLNRAVLLNPGKLGRFEALLEEYDDRQAAMLRIQLVGPLPPCSFSMIGKQSAMTDLETRSMDLLGVRTGVDAAALKSAWLTRARHHHPDLASGSNSVMQRLNEAYALLSKRLRGREVLTAGVEELTIRRDPLFEEAA